MENSHLIYTENSKIYFLLYRHISSRILIKIGSCHHSTNYYTILPHLKSHQLKVTLRINITVYVLICIGIGPIQI